MNTYTLITLSILAPRRCMMKHWAIYFLEGFPWPRIGREKHLSASMATLPTYLVPPTCSVRLSASRTFREEGSNAASLSHLPLSHSLGRSGIHRVSVYLVCLSVYTCRGVYLASRYTQLPISFERHVCWRSGIYKCVSNNDV